MFLRAVGSVLGHVAFLIGVRRGVTIDNLRHAFPDKMASELNTIARRSLANLCIVFAEMLYLRFASRHKVYNGLQINNLESVDHLLSGPDGAILLSGHLGNWEWLAIGCSLRIDRPLGVVVKNQRSSFAERFLLQMRTRFGNKMLNAGDVRAIYRALKNGELLAILGDQTAAAEDLRVPFFGREVPTFGGTARLALQTGAPILFLQPFKRTRRGYECRFHIIESGDLIGSTPENIKVLTARHTAALELAIREKPEFWLWQHRRWKHAWPDTPTT